MIVKFRLPDIDGLETALERLLAPQRHPSGQASSGNGSLGLVETLDVSRPNGLLMRRCKTRDFRIRTAKISCGLGLPV